jgi:hypothetical protein
VNQISGTSSSGADVQAQEAGTAADVSDSADRRESDRPGFGSRGRARRRARFLRKARELAYRDLGGLVFNLHRFGQRNDALVLAKLNTLGQIDAELRTLESALQERSPVTVLREAGITACPRCAAIHSSEDRFCPNCGLSMARHVDLPIAGGAVAGSPGPGAPAPGPAMPGAPAPGTAAPGTAAPGAPVPPTAGVTSAATPAPAPAPNPPTVPHATAPPPPFPPSSDGAPATPVPARRPDEATEILRPGAPGS